MQNLLTGLVFFYQKILTKNVQLFTIFCRVADNIADDENTITVKKEKFEKFKDNFENKILTIQ